jgi:hypothetical protein
MMYRDALPRRKLLWKFFEPPFSWNWRYFVKRRATAAAKRWRQRRIDIWRYFVLRRVTVVEGKWVFATETWVEYRSVRHPDDAETRRNRFFEWVTVDAT